MEDKPKEILYDNDARQALLRGIQKVARAVGETLGPTSNNVAIDRPWASPNIVHDGVTVARDIILSDPFENMGAKLVRHAASQSNDAAGDGTTTCTILTEAIVTSGLKMVAAGIPGMSLRWELEDAKEKVKKELTKLSKPINGKVDMESVATISAGDPQIGKIIAEALDKVGKDGVISVEEGKGSDISLEYKGGMQIDKGFVSHYFVTDTTHLEAEYEDAFILITDHRIDDINTLVPLLEKMTQHQNKPLVIIADGFSQIVLGVLLSNHLKGVFKVLPVNAPEFGDRRVSLMEDIAVVTGGTFFSHSFDRDIKTAELSDLGRASRVWADQSTTKIIDGQGKKIEIKERIEQIRGLISTASNEFNKEKFQERLAKLTSGVAVINVGGLSEAEMKEKKERVKDAVGATRAALEEGIVAGGGVTLIKVAKALTAKTSGEKILAEALYVPVRKLLSNAGVETERAIVEIENKDSDYGYNVVTKKYGSLFAMGVIDPVKVLKSSIENAISVAAMVLTTNCLVANEPEKAK